MEGQPAFGANLVRNMVGRELKLARAILVMVGLLTIVWEYLVLNDVHHLIAVARDQGMTLDLTRESHFELVAKANLAVGVAFLVCAFLVSRKPVIATATGAFLYGGTIVAQAVVDISQLESPTTLMITFAILSALVAAVRYARIYERDLRQRADFPSARVTSSPS